MWFNPKNRLNQTVFLTPHGLKLTTETAADTESVSTSTSTILVKPTHLEILQSHRIMKIKAVILTLALCLTLQAKPISLETVNWSIKESVTCDTIGKNNFYKHNSCDFELERARYLCKVYGDEAANENCERVGSYCVPIPGDWGCGTVENEGESSKSCLFRPRDH
ncbi:hypothetical protein BGW38_007886 [Lunasporangiospora selenospora]|uniref:Uncharacterized protein n=1 Tax=Lunasporangiospora selenospora TaxID=979761 RepID=A0A9P6FL76_9FUNG|nr:hypothetical protein BGW38_007886 [Lunasporangiospora selenospora]